MKRSLFSRRLSKLHSFTLVELLVVMGIIAILASVLFTAAGAAIRAAHRTQASAIATQIQTAVSSYYTEYSTYPIPSDLVTAPGQDVLISTNDAPHWENLMYALCGNINPENPGTALAAPPTVSNTRGVIFLNPKKSDLDANGVFVSPIGPVTTTGELYYNIAMDGNYDGILGNNGTANAMLPDFSKNVSPLPPTLGIMAGSAVWVNCNQASTTNAGFWVRTY